MNIEAELILKVGRKELRLSPDEARELRDALVELVGPKQPYYWYQPYPYITYTPNNAVWKVNGAYGTGVTTTAATAYLNHDSPITTDTVEVGLTAH